MVKRGTGRRGGSRRGGARAGGGRTGARDGALNVRSGRVGDRGGRGRMRGRRTPGRTTARVVNEEFHRTRQRARDQADLEVDKAEGIHAEGGDEARSENVGNVENAPNLPDQLYQGFQDAVYHMTRSALGDINSQRETRASAAMRQFRRMEPKEFKGGGDPIEAEEWIINCERIFDVIELIEDDLRVKAAKFYLKEEAGRWWRSMEEVWGVGALTWDVFKTIFLDEYFPQVSRNQKRKEFMELIQGNSTVQQYLQEFNKLARYGPELVSTEELKCRKFEEGLRLKLQGLVASQRLSSFAELVKTARRVEALADDRQRIEASMRVNTSRASSSRGGDGSGGVSIQQQRSQPQIQGRRVGDIGRFAPSVGHFPSPTVPYPVRPASSVGTSAISPRACYNCGREGHHFYSCPNLQCHRCGGKGHMKIDCPSVGESSGAPRVPYSSQPLLRTPPAGQRPSGVSRPSIGAASSQASAPSRGGYQGRGRGSAPQSQLSQARVYALFQTADKGEPSTVRGENRGVKERVAFKTKTQIEVLDDGFKWCRYGKKKVKNSPNPRNYYKCSFEGCPVKKRVERDSEDNGILITTYDGVHNHESPTRF